MAEVKFSEFPLASGANLAEITVVGLNEVDANSRFPGVDLKGDTGDQGVPGPTGGQGIQGIQGPAGLDGQDGIQGNQGIQGPQGDQGIQGTKGDQGIQGPVGPEGPQGIQGDAGSGYNLIGDISVAEANLLVAANINTNDAYFMLDSSPPDVQPVGAILGISVTTGDLIVWSDSDYFVNYGPQSGTVGATGPQGIQGDTGDQGIQGIQGDQGDVGPEGPAGVQGVQGIQGVKGDTGDTGVAGSDGAAATATAGTTTTLAPNIDATVVNSGSVSAAVFDFGIPQGVAGTTGTTGDTGPAGADGKTYYNGTSLPDPAGYADGDLFMVIP
jgi:hypothetical protein